MCSWEYDEFEAQTRDIKELRKSIYDQYPDHADEAKKMINGYLRFHDHHRYKVFNDLVLDKQNDFYNLNSAHLLISDMLHYRDNGGQGTDIQIDVFARKYIGGLPPPVIEGGKQAD